MVVLVVLIATLVLNVELNSIIIKEIVYKDVVMEKDSKFNVMMETMKMEMDVVVTVNLNKVMFVKVDLQMVLIIVLHSQVLKLESVRPDKLEWQQALFLTLNWIIYQISLFLQ